MARSHDVELVVLSIGGNDLGFADIITACVVAYATVVTRCQPEQQAKVDAAMPGAMAGVATAVDEIRAALSANGQGPDSYWLVLQSYPSPVPRGDENRYAEAAGGRLGVGGCPFFDSDSDWARDRRFRRSRRACASWRWRRASTSSTFQTRFPDARRAHARPRSQGAKRGDGRVGPLPGHQRPGTHSGVVAPQRLWAAGHRRCYSLLAQVQGSVRCVNTPGSGPSGMALVPSS